MCCCHARQVSAKLVKQLRDKSGAGMMDCKKALAQSNGDFDAAAEHLRKKGLASADKKAGRVAAEGAISSYIHAGSRCATVLQMYWSFTLCYHLDSKVADRLSTCSLTLCVILFTRCGMLRCAFYALLIQTSNTHASRLGVVVEVNCETDFVARGDKFRELVADLAMQIAASPGVSVVAVEDVSAEELDRERAIELQKEDILSKPEAIRCVLDVS